MEQWEIYRLAVGFVSRCHLLCLRSILRKPCLVYTSITCVISSAVYIRSNSIAERSHVYTALCHLLYPRFSLWGLHTILIRCYELIEMTIIYPGQLLRELLLVWCTFIFLDNKSACMQYVTLSIISSTAINRSLYIYIFLLPLCLLTTHPLSCAATISFNNER